MLKRKRIIYIITFIFITYFSIMFLPYIRQPKVSEEYKNAFNINDYLVDSDKYSVDYAKIIEDNEEALRERIRLISQANKKVILSTYAFKADESGKDIISALLDAARRGVDVYIYVDGVTAMLDMKNVYFKALASEDNVEIKVYNKINLLKPWALMGRLHDKYLIVDDRAYIAGGRNTYDYFLGDYEGYKNLDRDIFIYNSGTREDESSIYDLEDYFHKMWELRDSTYLYKKIKVKESSKVDLAKRNLKHRYKQLKIDKSDYFLKVDYSQYATKTNKVSILHNPSKIYPKEPQLFYAITNLILNAKKSAYIHTPYIICNKKMYDSLQEIGEKIEDSHLLCNSIANNGNLFGAADYQENKNKILDTGLQIYEYDGGTSYHAKSILIDDNISLIGSFNMDMRSVYLNTETMVLVQSKEVGIDLRNKMRTYESNSIKVIDMNNNIYPEGLEPMKASKWRRIRMAFIGHFLAWLRFLT